MTYNFRRFALNKSEKIRLYYGIFLSVLTVAVGIVFITTIADIYYTGKEQGAEVIYSVATITEHLTVPLIFLFTWIAAIIGGFVLSVVYPLADKKIKRLDDKRTLALLSSKIPAEGQSDEFIVAKNNIKKLQLDRIIVWTLALGILSACFLIILFYVYDPSHFSPSNFLEDMLTLVRNVIFFVGGGAVACIIAVAIDGIITKEEIAWVKKAIAVGDRKTAKKVEPTKKLTIAATVTLAALTLLSVVLYVIAPGLVHSLLNMENAKTNAITFIVTALLILALVIVGIVTAKVVKKYVPEKADKIIVLCTRIAVGSLAIAFIIVGVTNGGANDVLTKAIAICTECIGLG